MPKKYWFLLIATGLLLGSNKWLIYQNDTNKQISTSALIVGDSTLYPTLEVHHLTMKPAWYQFSVPAQVPPAQDLPSLAFIAQETSANSTLTNWLLVNQTTKTQKLPTQNGSLLMIQEAQDAQGKWRPVEFWTEQWGSSPLPTAHGLYVLAPQKALLISAPKYAGKLKTLFRFKLKIATEKSKNAIYYSPTFAGSLSPTQFEVGAQDKKKKISFLD